MQYRALSWERERRVVLVVLPKSGELFPEHFYLITDQDEHAYSAEEILHLYRRRGKAEAHMGELNQACSMALSSWPRPKTHYRGLPIPRKEEAQPEETPFYAHNEVLLQLYLLVYEVLHLGRCTMKQPGARHMHLKTFQKDVLKVGALIVRHARNIEIRIAFSAVAFWRQFWGRYQQLTWVTLE